MMACRINRRQVYSGVWLALLMLASGCTDEEITYREVMRPDEPIHAGEWSAFVRIVDQLPASKLRHLPDLQPLLPQWHQARTLPVDELAAEEHAVLEKSWDPSALARELLRTRGISRLIRSEKLTVEQFVGIALSVGAAMQRAVLPEDYPLDEIVQRGKKATRLLSEDHRLFANLSIEDRHRVLDDAVWLHRVHRARMLRAIPPRNVALVRKHSEWLRAVMPARYSASPFADVIDTLEEEGVPFEELSGSGSDATIEWSRADAIIGRAAPDVLADGQP